MRSSKVHYIAPSDITLTPNCNDNANDVAVNLASNTTIKVYCAKIEGLGYEDSSYREFSLSGINHSLRANVPYTIYARIVKSDQPYATLEFVRQIYGDGVHKYRYVTPDGLSPEGTYAQESLTSWYVIIGEVSSIISGKRTITLDTGVLGTTQYNNEWELYPDSLPLRVTISNSRNIATPYVKWNEGVTLNSALVRGWDTDTEDLVHHWGIVRDTNNADADQAWNSIDHSTFSSTGEITLTHVRGVADDFGEANTASFIITAYGLDEDGETYITLATGSITILSEAVEQYELAASATVMQYNPSNQTYLPASGIAFQIRAITQDGTTRYLSQTEITNGQLSLYAAPVGYVPDPEDPLSPITFVNGVATLPTTAFAGRTSVNTWLENAAHVEFGRLTIGYVCDGESITKNSETYRYATNNTGTRPAADSQDWQTTKPTLNKGYWLYTETTITWSDNSTTVLYTDERNPNDGVSGQGVIVDGATVMKYYVGTSNTTHPADDSSDWKDLSQVTQTQGKWLWSQATTYYRKSDSAAGAHDAGSSINYNVSYISKDGKTGRGISSITEYYQATNSSAARQAPTSATGWDTDPNLSGLTDKWNEAHKYLWNMEKTVYSNSDGTTTTEYSIPQIVAIWTKDGAAGKGIDSIVNYYKVTSSSTAPTKSDSGWDDSPITPGNGEYLWNYEVITYTDNTTSQTDVQMIGHNGADASEINPNILLRTSYDNGIDKVKEKWDGQWDYISIDTNADTEVLGRKSLRLNAQNKQSGVTFSQNVLGKIKPNTYYTVSFNAFRSVGGGFAVSFYNLVNGVRTNLFDGDVIVDGVSRTITDGNCDIYIGGTWDGARHTITFKTGSASVISTSNLSFIFYQAYSSNSAAVHSQTCICMPKFEEGQVATAYMANEDDLVGENGESAANLTLDNYETTAIIDANGNLLNTIAPNYARFYLGTATATPTWGMSISPGNHPGWNIVSSGTGSVGTLTFAATGPIIIEGTYVVTVTATYNNQSYAARWTINVVREAISYDIEAEPGMFIYNETKESWDVASIALHLVRVGSYSGRTQLSSVPSGYTFDARWDNMIASEEGCWSHTAGTTVWTLNPIDCYSGGQVLGHVVYLTKTGYSLELEIPTYVRNDAVLRPREWVTGSTVKYYSGVEGEKYRDVVAYNDGNGNLTWYSCIATTPNNFAPTSGQTPANYTQYFTAADGQFEFVSTNLLLAQMAYIKNLGVQYLRMGGWPSGETAPTGYEPTSGAIEMYDITGQKLLFQVANGNVVANTGTFNNVKVHGEITAETGSFSGHIKTVPTIIHSHNVHEFFNLEINPFTGNAEYILDLDKVGRNTIFYTTGRFPGDKVPRVDAATGTIDLEPQGYTSIYTELASVVTILLPYIHRTNSALDHELSDIIYQFGQGAYDTGLLNLYRRWLWEYLGRTIQWAKARTSVPTSRPGWITNDQWENWQTYPWKLYTSMNNKARGFVGSAITFMGLSAYYYDLPTLAFWGTHDTVEGITESWYENSMSVAVGENVTFECVQETGSGTSDIIYWNRTSAAGSKINYWDRYTLGLDDYEE